MSQYNDSKYFNPYLFKHIYIFNLITVDFSINESYLIYIKFVKDYLIISADVSAVDTELSISEWDFTEKHNLYSGGND